MASYLSAKRFEQSERFCIGRDSMRLRSCAYCGRVHPAGFDCGERPKRNRKGTAEQHFRSSARWTETSIRIRERDQFLCVYCLRYDKRITTELLEVHHIVPITDDYDSRLDGCNLITLCREHHEQAEAGAISRSELLKLAEEQERKQSNGLVCL